MAWLRCFVLSSAVIPAVQGLQTGAAATGPSIYIEVAAPKGSNGVETLESELLRKYASGQNTFRLSEETRISQDDAYKSLVLNSVGSLLSQTHDFCAKNAPCIQSFIQSPAAGANVYALMGKMYAEAQAQGCLQVGGCKAEVFGTLNWHVEHAHNVLIESGVMDAAAVRERLTIANRNTNYQKILVVVANNYRALSSRQADTAAMSTSIQAFMADPQANGAPVLINPREFSYAYQKFTCTMHQMLACMAGDVSSIQGQPCDPKFDGVYVIDRTEGDGSERMAVAMKGSPRNDPGFLDAQAVLRKSLPAGAAMCAPTHGMPTAQSLFSGFFR